MPRITAQPVDFDALGYKHEGSRQIFSGNTGNILQHLVQPDYEQ